MDLSGLSKAEQRSVTCGVVALIVEVETGMTLSAAVSEVNHLAGVHGSTAAIAMLA